MLDLLVGLVKIILFIYSAFTLLQSWALGSEVNFTHALVSFRELGGGVCV